MPSLPALNSTSENSGSGCCILAAPAYSQHRISPNLSVTATIVLCDLPPSNGHCAAQESPVGPLQPGCSPAGVYTAELLFTSTGCHGVKSGPGVFPWEQAQAGDAFLQRELLEAITHTQLL